MTCVEDEDVVASPPDCFDDGNESKTQQPRFPSISNLDEFLMNVYTYFCHGGFEASLIKSVTRFLLHLVIYILSNVLVLWICVLCLGGNDADYYQHFDLTIHLVPILFGGLCLVSFYLKVMDLLELLPKLWDIRDVFQNQLMVSPTDLEFCSWEDIVQRILHAVPNITRQQIHHSLTHKLDRMSEILRSDVLDLQHQTGVHFWYGHCFHEQIESLLLTVPSSSPHFRQRIYMSIFIQILCMPFLFTTTFFHTIVDFVIKHFNPTTNTTDQTWSLFVRWTRLRQMGELPFDHHHQKQDQNTQKAQNLLLSCSSSITWTMLLTKCGQMMTAGLLIIIILFILLTDPHNTTLMVWFVSIFGTIFGLLRWLQPITLDHTIPTSTSTLEFPFDDHVYQIQCKSPFLKPQVATTTSPIIHYITPEQFKERISQLKTMYYASWYATLGEIVCVFMCPFLLWKHVLKRQQYIEDYCNSSINKNNPSLEDATDGAPQDKLLMIHEDPFDLEASFHQDDMAREEDDENDNIIKDTMPLISNQKTSILNYLTFKNEIDHLMNDSAVI